MIDETTQGGEHHDAVIYVLFRFISDNGTINWKMIWYQEILCAHKNSMMNANKVNIHPSTPKAL